MPEDLKFKSFVYYCILYVLLKVITFSALCSLFSFLSTAQYTPLSNDESIKAAYIQAANEKFKADKATVSGAYKKDIISMYKMRHEINMGRVENGTYLFDRTSQACFRHIVRIIARANPSYNFRDVKPVLCLNHSANASSIGEGTLAVNIGLLRHIQNQEQLVFIFCHEIAHYLLNHSNINIQKMFDKNQKEATKKQIQAILGNDYNQTTKLKALVKAKLYSTKYDSRQNEYAADSLGMLLYMNTKLDPLKAAETMDLLESLNEYQDSVEINIFDYFGVKQTSTETTTILEDAELKSELDKDSVLSHPYCKDRKECLLRQMKRAGMEGSGESYQLEAFADLTGRMEYEYGRSLFHYQALDLSLLYALRKLHSRPDDEYYKNLAVTSMFGLYEARKNHKLQLYSYSPDNTTDSSHKRLSQYIYGSRLSVFSKNALSFCQKYISDPTTEANLYMLAVLAKAGGDSEAFQTYKSAYLKKYPKGNHYNQITLLK